MELTPSVLREYMRFLSTRKIEPPNLRLLICGSDSWTMSEYRLAKELFKTRVINSYGLTEATIDSTYFEENHENLSKLAPNSLVPIGKPFPHVNIYIINDTFKPASINEIGEIYIGGTGVSLGYLNQKQLTNENFVVLKNINDNKILYKTGDFGKLLPDGNIEFIGRNQSILKIDGQRVELLSLESILNQYSKVKKCIVVPELNYNHKYKITCFILPADDSINFHELCDHITHNLPSYYLPSKVMLISEIIINKNGKIERNPSLQKITGELKRELLNPKTHLENKIKNLWVNLIGHEDIGVNCDYSEFGGSSLSLMSVIMSLNKEYGINIHYSESLRTIKSLSKLVQEILALKNICTD